MTFSLELKVLNQVVNIFHLVGFLFCRGAQRYCYVYHLRGNQDPASRLHYCFLTVPPWCLRPLPSLISSCLNLAIGTQGRSWRLNEAYFLQARNSGHGKIFVPRSPTGSCLVSCPPLLWWKKREGVSDSPGPHLTSSRITTAKECSV